MMAWYGPPPQGSGHTYGSDGWIGNDLTRKTTTSTTTWNLPANVMPVIEMPPNVLVKPETYVGRAPLPTMPLLTRIGQWLRWFVHATDLDSCFKWVW